MVKPQSLWAAFKTVTDSKELGDICRKLGGQNVNLSAGAKMTYGIILTDNEWHTESIEAQREKDRKRQAEYRAKRKVDAGADAVETSAAGAATVAPVSKIAQAVKPSAVDWSKVDISEDAIMGSSDDAVLMAAKVTGDTDNPNGQGWWRRWIREYPNDNGEAEFRQELFTFMREGCAGESLGRNPASVFTARLKKRFNPDKKKHGGAA